MARGACSAPMYSDDILAERKKAHTRATRNPGFEAIRNNGERHYTNHAPYFTVHYFPGKTPGDVELLWYEKNQDRYKCEGYSLLSVYEDLKTGKRGALVESTGPYDPAGGRPYILKIEYEMVM